MLAKPWCSPSVVRYVASFEAEKGTTPMCYSAAQPLHQTFIDLREQQNLQRSDLLQKGMQECVCVGGGGMQELELIATNLFANDDDKCVYAQ